MALKIKKNTPLIIGPYDDYHFLSDVADGIHAIASGFKTEELDCEKYGFKFNGRYYLLVWHGKKPSKENVIKYMVKLGCWCIPNDT